jgi:hypothetical protein
MWYLHKYPKNKLHHQKQKRRRLGFGLAGFILYVIISRNPPWSILFTGDFRHGGSQELILTKKEVPPL